MNSFNKISEAEMKVMSKLWDFGEMVTVSEIMAALNEDGEKWTHQTVGTFLKRLETKGMVASSKNGKSLYYFPLMSREQFKSKEASGFVKSKFGGSLKGFLSAFSSSKDFSDESMKELKEWFDDIDNK